jgi:hypothetical protein
MNFDDVVEDAEDDEVDNIENTVCLKSLALCVY